MPEKTILFDAHGQPLRTQSQGSNQFSQFNLTRIGGIQNPATGLGGPGDKTSSAYFQPTLLRTREQVEPIYLESWVARKFIDLPIDDMFFKPRRWTGDDTKAIQAYEDAWAELDIERWLTAAMKNGRLYGTGFLVMMVDGTMPDVPLEPDMVKEGALKSVLAFDRFDASVEEWQKNLYEPNFGGSDHYRFHTRFGHYENLNTHRSRLLRFDGIPPLKNTGWDWYYDRNWGVSELIPALVEIIHDASFSAAVAHMGQEASIPVVKMQGFQDSVSGRPGSKEASVEQMGAAINYYKSIFRTMFLGESDEFDRVAINFGGLYQLLDKYAMRVAAMAGIPATRFMSRSPDGMNATGESDMKNYAIHVGAMQRRKLAQPLKRLDAVIARHVGLSAPLEYEWPPLMDLSQNEQYTNAQLLAEALAAAQPIAGLDENEVREVLNTNDVFDFEPMAEDEMGTRQEMERMLEEQRMMRRQGGQAGNSGKKGDE